MIKNDIGLIALYGTGKTDGDGDNVDALEMLLVVEARAVGKGHHRAAFTQDEGLGMVLAAAAFWRGEL